MAHPAASSSSITYKWPYDVFLSFYGDDTRLGFISHLYESLRQRGLRVFIDYKIRNGENITPALFKAIEESRIAIIVFSENYANSTFCLQELEKIVECFKEESRLIYPVFYYVDPSELRRPRGSYAEALARLEKDRFKNNRQKVEKWRKALSQAADLKGCHLIPKIASEQECIKMITNEVAVRINLKPLHVTNYPVGLVSRVKEVISSLDLWSTKENKMTGIWGAGGIGKSTIARAVYNSIADNFEALCFLSDVSKQSNMPNGLSHLQETLFDKLVMEEDLKLGDYHEGIPIIEHRLSQKKILLILDDVDESNQLQALAGSCSWFGCGSRIITTTRNRQLLVSHGVKSIYEVKELNDEESSKLLRWYAFRKENIDSNYVEVCNRAVDYSCGFPIALEVIGSYLAGKEANLWSPALTQFKSTPYKQVFNLLKLSCETLEEKEEQVFLDLACFFNGEKLADVIDIISCVRAIEPIYAINVLIDKSLIRIEQGHVKMHDLIENVGKTFVQEKSRHVLGEQSRLWFYQDILHVLQQDMGTDKVEAIVLDLPENEEVQWSGEEFMGMKNLKMLVIRNASFSECPKYLPNSLRWLEWKGCPFKFLPYKVRPTQLVYLDLSNSYLELLHPFDKVFHNLSHMNLRNCKQLKQIPDLSGAFNLREVCLDDCIGLIEVHDSVGFLKQLRELSAMRCKNLKILPSCLKSTFLKHINLFGCSSLERFPEISVRMEEIQTLDIDETAITELPSSICNLIGLEILSMEECPNLKQLPAGICTLPNLWKLTANFCEGIRDFKMSEGGDKASLDCLAMSLKMEQLCFSNCNLSDDSLSFCLPHFTNVIHLDLSFNNFTVLPECIKEYHNLKYLLLDNCNQLQHIGGMPLNLEKFSAIYCTSLTGLSERKVLKQAFNFQPGKRNFIFPGRKLPERLHNYSRGSFVSFWIRDMFPTIFLCILVKDDQDYVYNFKFSVHINDTKLKISSEWLLLSTIKTDHIFICDIQSIIQTSELPLENKWNQVKISLESKKLQEIKGEKEIYFGVHVYNLQSNLQNIQFVDPKIYRDHNLLQEILEEQDLEEFHEDMNLDSNSKKSAESIENPTHYYQETTTVPEGIEGLPAMFVNSFKRRLVNENLLHRLHETLCSALAVVKDKELRNPTEDQHLPLYDFMFKLQELLDKIGDGHVTELQCRELEVIIYVIKVHLSMFEDRQNHDADDPISSSMNFNLWEKKSCIGSGGYGIVHVDLNRKTGTSCAIKEMLYIDDLYAQALHKEIKILSRLEHQNIVKYYGSKIAESQVSIYMEYVQPGSLKKYIASRGALQESLVRKFTAQILSGLAYLHSHRVVHRDIKPDNLLVDSQTNVKVADFGLAKHLAQSVGNHSVDGTFYYAAPEVIQNKAYKSSGEASAADIWSLGCVVIEMFTAVHPWPDCSLPIQVIYKVCFYKQYPAIPANLSNAGKDFLKRCFTRNPAERLSAADLLRHPFVTTKLSC